MVTPASSSARRRSYTATNRLINPLLAPLLASGAGRWFGRRLALLRCHGRRSGIRRQVVAQYVRDRTVVWIVVGAPESKVWWRNFRDGAPLEVHLAGQMYHGWAIALDGGERGDEVAAGLRAYALGASKAAKTLGLRTDLTAPESDAAVREVATRTIMVRAELQSVVSH